MSLAKHLEEAAARLKDASARIEEARTEPVTQASLQHWLAALTDYCAALADIHSFNNESVHEKLHQLASRVGLREFAPVSRQD
jgi:hypothetical protein